MNTTYNQITEQKHCFEPPFMDQNEIKAIEICLNLFKKPINVLEWGGGKSTLFFSSMLQQGSSWLALEHNLSWFQEVKSKIDMHPSSCASIVLIQPDRPFDGRTDGDFSTFRNYVLSPVHLGQTYDFILVDGRARVECLAVGWSLLKDNGVMVLHDAQRKQYAVGVPEDAFSIRLINPNVLVEGPISTLFMVKQHNIAKILAESLTAGLANNAQLEMINIAGFKNSFPSKNVFLTDLDQVKQNNVFADDITQPLKKSNTEDTEMVLMQVHTFYQAYLEEFYLQHTECTNFSFSEQINALVRDGFSANHMMAPYLNQLGYEAYLIIANNPHSQSSWIEENKISDVDRNNWVHDIVRKQIELIKPEVLYLSDPITFDSRFVRSLSYRPKLILGWRAADIPSETDWSEFDIMLSCLSGLRDVARKLGAKSSEHFFPGFPVWMNDLTEAVQPSHDVVFSGSWTPIQHQGRNMLLSAVALDSREQYSCAFYLNAPMNKLPPEVAHLNKGARFGTNMYRALRSGKIVLDARARHTFIDKSTNLAIDMGGTETANMRIFEATGCGSFLLTEHFDNLNEFFEIGTEIETFRNAAELKEKIHYYLAHPEEREAIARRGQERCLRDYSMERRAEEFDRIIRRHLSSQSSRSVSVLVGVAELKQQAELLLASGDVRAAFERLIEAKALKQTLEGLDLLRAHCFMKMNQPLGAVEALREELRWFPNHQEARSMLAELQKQMPTPADATIGEDEFQQLLQQIRPYTMLSEQRLYSLYKLARHVCENNIPGNFVECGVAAGGSSALLAWVIKKYSSHPRTLYACDSFSGMPAPTADDSHQGVDAQSTGWGTGTCSAPEGSVREICNKLEVADILVPVKGYFEETLPHMRDWMGMIALLHMDGDWYVSTRAILDNLYDHLMDDALIQVDDYGYWEGCQKAIHEFETARSIKFAIKPIDGTGVWFAKPDRFPANSTINAKLITEFGEDDPNSQGIESQMSANERFQLYWAVRNVLPDRHGLRRFIEIGSYSGASLFLTCKAFMRNDRPFQGVAVEPGGTSLFYRVHDAVKDHVIHMQKFSHDAAQSLAVLFGSQSCVDFILVDGDHTYQGVHQDIEDYYPFLTPGGIMLFHDWLPTLNEENRKFIYYHHANNEPGIRQACQELMEEKYGCERIVLPLLYPTNPAQTQAQLPIIPGVYSTMRAYRKPLL